MARHVLARRQHPGARILEAVGAWFADEPAGALRFVPPLLEHDEPSAAASQETYALPEEIADDDFSMQPADVEPEVDVRDLPTAVQPTSEAVATPARQPIGRTDTTRRDRSQSAPDAGSTRQIARSPSDPAARSASTEPAATRDSRSTATPAPPPRARPDIASRVESAPPQPTRRFVEPASPAARPAAVQGAPVGDSAGPTSELAPIDGAAESTVERPDASRRNRDIAATPNAADTRMESQPVADRADARATTLRSADDRARVDAPEAAAKPVERTPHDEIVQRALGALRAAGELPSAPRQPTASRRGTPTSGLTEAASAPPASSAPRAVTPAKQSVASPPSVVPSAAPKHGVANPIATEPAVAASDITAPRAEPPVEEADAIAPSADAPRADVEAPDVLDVAEEARVDASARAESPTAPQAASSEPAREAPRTEDRGEDRADVAQAGPRIDERRQARRPAHLVRERPESSTQPSPPPPPARGPTQSPPSNASSDRGPASSGQFQFSDVERTPQDWQRLLFEATTPPRPGASRARSAPPPETGAPRPAAPQRDVPGASRAPARPSAPSARQGEAGERPENRPAGRGVPNERAPLAPPIPEAPRGSTATPPILGENASDARPGDTQPRSAAQESEAPRTGSRTQASSASAPPPAAVANALRATPSEPVAPSTRRFLRPLVGIDPDTVRIHRGERAAEIADLHDAKAIAVDNDIALGAGHDERDPATIALVAHELTHVARARDRRFVPPIARDSRSALSQAAPAAPGRTAQRRGTPRPASTDDEETVAGAVEARVRDAAARERERPVTLTPNADLDADFDAAYAEDEDDAPAADQSRADTTTRASVPGDHGTAGRSPWGALPAPWEPLPPSLVRGRSSDSLTAAPAPNASPQFNAPTSHSSAGSGGDAPAVHRAAQGNSAGEEPAHAEGPAEATDAGPDMDALARQVYDVLKRRLAAERRRGA